MSTKSSIKWKDAHNALNLVDMLLCEAGYAHDSSLRHNLSIAKSMFSEAERRLSPSAGEDASPACEYSLERWTYEHDRHVRDPRGEWVLYEDVKTLPRSATTTSTLDQYKAFARRLRDGEMFEEPLSWPTISEQVHMAADTIDALLKIVPADRTIDRRED